MIWLIAAVGSAIFAGMTSVLVKIGLEDTDSNVATALRTFVVVLFAWIMVVITDSYQPLSQIQTKSVVYLCLSGLATGASWLCYFKALQLGDVNKVVPIDKTSTVLTILLAVLLLKEPISLWLVLGMILILTGTMLMVQNRKIVETKGNNVAWKIYAVLSAVFASLTAILGKVGIEGVASNYGMAIRTCIVLIMAWLIVFMQKKQGQIRSISKKSWCFLVFSGITTGLSWLCYYDALQIGQASIVVPIDKMSIWISVLFAGIFLKEKLSKKAWAGLMLMTIGTLMLLF
ncbi:EamA family transporter [Lachnospiraceae bacterium ZAX-1]